MEVRHHSVLRLTCALLLAAQFGHAAAVLAAVAPAKPATSVARPSGLVSRAQGFYRDGRYDEALGLLAGPILRRELAGDELREARIVLARCYVKKGMLPRAKEHFGAVLAADPAFVLDAKHADAEELAVFAQLKGVAAAPLGSVAAKPDATTGKPSGPAPGTTRPVLHKPAIESASSSKPGWLARNKFLAIAVVAGGGVAAALAMGGGGDGAAVPGARNLAGFPAPPGGH